ncbi:DUF3322 domain-containing protein [Tomitella biformata]|uniref:DUF3322 domain-containing protein n=1 Tax=Tomitella biformata TaxID=630403 RepID=UPI000464935D|nr:DUF3322 domain-containing protein [Tomitella biformata]
MSTCLPPTAVAERAATAYRRRRSGWLVDPAAAQDDSLSISLKPPTEAQVHAGFDAVVAWVRTWQSYAGAGTVEWETRRWANYGSQDIPVRVLLSGPDVIASAARASTSWLSAKSRLDRLLAGRADGLRPAAAAAVGKWESLTEPDFARLLAALTWLTEHPDSGWYIRQLPVPGVDTKWIGRHRGLLESLLTGVRGEMDLGVRGLPTMRRIAVCDRALLPGAPRIFDTSLDELAVLDLRPARVLILENQEGLHALPDLTGAVALHGRGYSVSELAGLEWMHEVRVQYWGDLDSHGFAILDRLRHHLPGVESLLMDRETLEAWLELAVTEESPAIGELTMLTVEERAALAVIREGSLRLEQERVPWPWALERLATPGAISTT